MGTTCVIALSLVCYIMFEIDFLRGFDPREVMDNMGKIWEKSWKCHGIHEQNPCMNPGCIEVSYFSFVTFHPVVLLYSCK